VDEEAVKALLEARDKFLQTPLHKAAMGGRAPVVSLLLEAGAYANCTNKVRSKDRNPQGRRGAGGDACCVVSCGAYRTTVRRCWPPCRRATWRPSRSCCRPAPTPTSPTRRSVALAGGLGGPSG
jgi:ankyrin repeat protein